MFSDETTKKSIYAGVISSIIVILFIQPLINLLGKIIIWLGDNVYTGISASMYQSAAIGHRESFSFLTLMLMLCLITSVITGFARNVMSNKSKRDDSKFSILLKKINKKLLPICIIVFVLDSVYIVTNQVADFQMNASFQQRLVVLTPHIDDKEIKLYRARWAAMTSRADYLSITKDMEQLAQGLKVILPPLLWK